MTSTPTESPATGGTRSGSVHKPPHATTRAGITSLISPPSAHALRPSAHCAHGTTSQEHVPAPREHQYAHNAHTVQHPASPSAGTTTLESGVGLSHCQRPMPESIIIPVQDCASRTHTSHCVQGGTGADRTLCKIEQNALSLETKRDPSNQKIATSTTHTTNTH